MARTHQRLTAQAVARMKSAGYYADGDGLYLQVTGNGAKSWIYRYMITGRRREMGLGALSMVSLAEARDRASDARRMVRSGQDPIEAREAEQARQRLEDARSITFDAAARLYIADHEATWSARHTAQWKSSLAAYVSPRIGTLSVGSIGVPEVTRVLDPIWHDIPETANRVRSRIELVLDWSRARGHRAGENPARWRGHLDAVYPKRSKLRKVQHLAAVAIDELPAVYARLCADNSVAALAARFTILTAVRVSVTTGCSEPEMRGDVWSISAKRMKADRDHNVPLSREARAVLELVRQYRTDERIFPGRPGRGINRTAVLKALKGAGTAATVHGCRSTFKDWATERTNFPAEVSEMALAHAIGDKTEAAYRRGELLRKRAAMMEAWAQFVSSPRNAKVVDLARRIG